MMIHDKFECLVGWINNQGIPIELFNDDHILNAKLIIGQSLLFPTESFTWFTQELDEFEILSHLEWANFDRVAPIRIKNTSVEVIEEADIGKEGRSKECITNETGHLIDKILATLFPSHSFRAQVFDELYTPIDFLLNLFHVCLDAFYFTNESSILGLEVFNTLFKMNDFIFEFLRSLC